MAAGRPFHGSFVAIPRSPLCFGVIPKSECPLCDPRLNAASNAKDMDLPGLRLHELSGNRAGIWSVTVSGNWRVTFRFEDGDAEIVNYEDYH